jgi:hypothetical protein
MQEMWCGDHSCLHHRLIACTRHGRRHTGAARRPRYDDRPPGCKRLRARVAVPAGQQPRAHHQSPVSPFLLPASCWWSGRTLARSATPPRPVAQRSLPTRPPPTPLLLPQIRQFPQKSRLRAQLADPPAAGAFPSENSVSAVVFLRRRVSCFPARPGPFPDSLLLLWHLQAAAAAPRLEPAAGIVPRRGSGLIRPRADRLGGDETRRRGDRPEVAAPGRVRGAG